jgi:hypothetical protein
VSFLPAVLLTIDVRTGTPSAALPLDVPDADAVLVAPPADGLPNMGARVDMVASMWMGSSGFVMAWTTLFSRRRVAYGITVTRSRRMTRYTVYGSLATNSPKMQRPCQKPNTHPSCVHMAGHTPPQKPSRRLYSCHASS